MGLVTGTGNPSLANQPSRLTFGQQQWLREKERNI